MTRQVTFLLVFGLSAISAHAQKVFSVEYESRADVKVFVVDYESRADLLVYKEEYESRADGNEGHWFFVEYESRAGWKNKEKIHFFY